MAEAAGSQALSDSAAAPADEQISPGGGSEALTSGEELLEHVRDAIRDQIFDTTVVNAAMKRCEQGRFWKALLEVKQLQATASWHSSYIFLHSS